MENMILLTKFKNKKKNKNRIKNYDFFPPISNFYFQTYSYNIINVLSSNYYLYLPTYVIKFITYNFMHITIRFKIVLSRLIKYIE